MTVRSAVWEVEMLDVLNDGVSPRSEGIAKRFAVPENPFSPVIVIVELALEPAWMLSETGLAAMEKSGPRTVTETVTKWKSEPETPVTKTVYVPGTVEFTLRMAEPLPITKAGEIDAFRLNDGEAARLTLPANPLREDIVIVDIPGLVVLIVNGFGDASIEKSGAITVTVTKTEWLREPLVPVTSIV